MYCKTPALVDFIVFLSFIDLDQGSLPSSPARILYFVPRNAYTLFSLFNLSHVLLTDIQLHSYPRFGLPASLFLTRIALASHH